MLRTIRTCCGFFVILLALGGCQGSILDPEAVEDADGDGFTAFERDCNDHNPDISPNGTETCNGLDDNCDGQVDEDVQDEVYPDVDNDGYGDEKATVSKVGCGNAVGFVKNNLDCNDANKYINPKAVEVCDKIDNNCDDVVDPSESADARYWYQDLDDDSYGNTEIKLKACTLPNGYSDNDKDCNDIDPKISPDAVEVCDYIDNNCNQTIDEGNDANGNGQIDDGEDFDRDNNGTPDCQADEVCDGYDNNGDGQVDEGFDKDGDGYTQTACDCKSGGSNKCGLDCNDLNGAINPKALEVCDGIDNNCDKAIDENSSADVQVWFVDFDGDGYGVDDDETNKIECYQPVGYVLGVPTSVDCDDNNAQRNPGLEEYCDDVDNDCDGIADEDLTYVLFYIDQDGDSFGADYDNKNFTTVSDCAPPEGFVANHNDCDDSVEAVNPNETELCNGYDDNCDDAIDEDTAADVKTWHEDKDNDTYGNQAVYKKQCYQPPGYVAEPPSEIFFDCDDENKSTYPNAPEQCDKKDNNCNTKVDDNVNYYMFYPDLDHDEFGNQEEAAVLSCVAPNEDTILIQVEGVTCTDYCSQTDCETGNCYLYYQFNDALHDCNDEDAAINPDATEVCDEIDNNCDKTTDEYHSEPADYYDGVEDESLLPVTYYKDTDSDGYGDAAAPYKGCPVTPPGYTEPVPPAGYIDNNLDCNDQNDKVSPAAKEVCDSIDNDCNGLVDENTDVDAKTWYADADGDSFGNPSVSKKACYLPNGYVANNTDCDDTNKNVNPAAKEVCEANDIDEDCDGKKDEDDASNAPTWYADVDKDGYGSASYPKQACDNPAGYVSDNTDCDDTNPNRNPSKTEVCDANNIDENCNFKSDDNDPTTDSTTKLRYYPDLDSDGYGDKFESSTLFCDPPTKWSLTKDDCDDTRNYVYPGATEVCDSTNIDEDCDGLADNNDSSASSSTKSTFYPDADKDTYGDATDAGSLFCDNPSTASVAWSTNKQDCDDTNASISPKATEICDTNNVDEDCDGKADDKDSSADTSTKTRYYPDADKDGYGDKSNSGTLYCDNPSTSTASYTTNNSDCNDTDNKINPVATEVCNGYDDNCNNQTDEGAADFATWYEDKDGDTYGNVSKSTKACSKPTGYVNNSLDCDDNKAAINPGATEICDSNNTDEDCDGKADDADSSTDATTKATTYYPDADKDGYGDKNSAGAKYCDNPSTSSDVYVTNKTDCDDTASSVNPGAVEICADGVDNNCANGVDEASSANATTWYIDADGDGFGATTTTKQQCAQPTGFVSNSGDCNDTDSTINPNAAEKCDSVDNNCKNGTDEAGAVDAPTWYEDFDGDTYGNGNKTKVQCSKPSGYVNNGSDCNDTDKNINPSATESCNGTDDDCDGQTDETGSSSGTWYKDADGDGYGTTADTKTACTTPTGYVSRSGDCDDSNANISPNAQEVCDSSNTDEDCDTKKDNDDSSALSSTKTTWYKDIDKDTYGDQNDAGSLFCDDPSTSSLKYSSNNKDCNDSASGGSSINPDATEVCDSSNVDEDCDSLADDKDPSTATSGKSTWYPDSDKDTYGASTSAGVKFCDDPSVTSGQQYVSNKLDCNDSDSSIKPGATEKCDGIDNDCDGSTDPSSSSDATTWYPDADSDGYGNASGTTKTQCSQPNNYVTDKTDCNDSNALIHPGGQEVCDSSDTDEDCDSKKDNDDSSALDSTKTTFYTDGDGDTYGKSSDSGTKFCDIKSGYSANKLDCNDSSASINPAATEVCDSSDTDEDCDGLSDDADSSAASSGKTTFYPDSDKDTYGASTSGGVAYCDNPSTSSQKYVTNKTDCNDADSSIYPGATESCNAVDDDCDSSIDEGVKTTYYVDKDGDTYGTTAVTTTACSKPTGFSTVSTDCDDNDATQYPGATEACNGEDDDCDSTTDEGFTKSTFYIDSDGDTFGHSGTTTQACTKPSGYSALSTDCNDANSAIYPGATETCDGVDNDCDSSIDEGVKTTYYVDADSDTYGSSSVSTTACSKPSGFVTNSTDCNDADSSIHPNATETCNNKDDDCDSSTDEGFTKSTFYIDSDGDTYGHSGTTTSACTAPSGYSSLSTDCNDSNANIYPGATESCDGVDNDCDSSIDEGVKTTYYADGDSDTFGNPNVTTAACSKPSGFVTDNTDCNDSNSSINTSATEVCDSANTDEDCDTFADNDDASASSATKSSFYVDSDGDGYGDEDASASLKCDVVAGYAANNEDCDDGSATVYPAAADTCSDGTDSDCDPGGTCTLALSSAKVDLVAKGATLGDEAGAVVVSAGDVNGDGYEDLLVGAPNYDAGTAVDAGAVYLIYGASTLGASSTSSIDFANSGFALFKGETAGDHAGAAIAAGDVDGDGFSDFLVGAPGYDDGVSKVDAGCVYLVRGKPTAFSATNVLTVAVAQFKGAAASDKLGASVAVVGRVNQDPFPDIVLGAPGTIAGAKPVGAVYLFNPNQTAFAGSSTPNPVALSSANASFTTTGVAEEIGTSVSAAGDVDRDGKADFLVGATGAKVSSAVVGKAYVFLGKNIASTLAADYTLEGETDLDAAGKSVASAGDVDRDGKPDILIGAPNYDNSTTLDVGRVYLVYAKALSSSSTIALSGTSNIVKFTGTAANDHAGASLSPAGDYNGDGFADFLIGAPSHANSAQSSVGIAYLIQGPVSSANSGALSNADGMFFGQQATTGAAGASVGVCDFNGDGFDDLLIGDPKYNRAPTTGVASGIAYGVRGGIE